MRFITTLLTTALLLLTSPVYALSAADQHTVDQLVNGGPVSIRNAAKNIYHTGTTNTEILDTLAEVVLQNYHKTDRNTIDAMSWSCRALGNSGNARYRSALEEVEQNGGHRKLKKYAKKALKQLPSEEVAQYQKGTVSLDSLRSQANKSTAKAAAPTSAAPASQTSGDKQPISAVQVGMSLEQVYALVGHPTATTTYQTGKAWIPFNYKGGDSARQDALYKGQGRVVFSNDSYYNNTWRVLEVRLDPNETGYP